MDLTDSKYDEPCMSKQCKEFIEHFIPKYGINNILEFGSGGSTIWFSKLIKGNITSIEHDRNFFQRLRNIIKKKNIGSRISLNISPDEEIYAKYIKFLEREYDLVFIDGIKRIECMEESACKAPCIMIHDSERKEYKEGYNYLESYGYRDISPEGINLKVYHHANPDRKLRRD